MPARLRLIYLADGALLDYSPDIDELALRAGPAGHLAGHPKGRHHRRFPRHTVAHVQLVLASGAVSGVRRDTAGVPGLAGGGVTDSCYRRLGEHEYASTDFTRSNWTPEIQHGSPRWRC
jgi:hypothetical protein